MTSNLSEVQFHDVKDIGNWHSNEFDAPMSRVARLPASKRHGSYSLQRVRALTASVRKYGVTDPLVAIDVPGREYPVLHDGHHRYVAARQTGQQQLPVRFIS